MSWNYVERTENDMLISIKVKDESHATVCTVYGSTSPMNDQYVGASRLTANVNLICAAPDLLETLQELLASYESMMHNEFDFPNDQWSAEGRNDEEALNARKAIAKALAQ